MFSLGLNKVVSKVRLLPLLDPPQKLTEPFPFVESVKCLVEDLPYFYLN